MPPPAPTAGIIPSFTPAKNNTFMSPSRVLVISPKVTESSPGGIIPILISEKPASIIWINSSSGITSSPRSSIYSSKRSITCLYIWEYSLARADSPKASKYSSISLRYCWRLLSTKYLYIVCILSPAVILLPLLPAYTGSSSFAILLLSWLILSMSSSEYLSRLGLIHSWFQALCPLLPWAMQ